MTNFYLAFEALSATALLAVCSLGIWHRAYEDTVVQRVGLSVTAFTASATLLGLAMGSDTRAALIGTTLGCAVFAFGCFLKYRVLWLGGRK